MVESLQVYLNVITYSSIAFISFLLRSTEIWFSRMDNSSLIKLHLQSISSDLLSKMSLICDFFKLNRSLYLILRYWSIVLILVVICDELDNNTFLKKSDIIVQLCFNPDTKKFIILFIIISLIGRVSFIWCIRCDLVWGWMFRTFLQQIFQSVHNLSILLLSSLHRAQPYREEHLLL